MNGTAISVFACVIVVAGVLGLIAGLAGDSSGRGISAEALTGEDAGAVFPETGGS